LKNPRLSIGISIGISLCLFGMHIHEIIYYTTIYHLSTNSSICVTNFDTHLISTYNRVSTLIHYLLPFCIQIIAIIRFSLFWLPVVEIRQLVGREPFDKYWSNNFEHRKNSI
jgi:hypothetical protein